MKHLLPGLFLAAALLSGCGKSTDPTPPPQPGPAGTYTDATGTAFPLTALRATVSAVPAQAGKGPQQRVNVYGTLPDGQIVLTGYTVNQAGMPTTAGPLPMAPASDTYYLRVAPAADTTPAYGSVGVSVGTLEAEASGAISGEFSGPLRPATLPGPANPPKAHVTFAHVAVTP